jgi:hypothetical protein
MMSHRPTHPNRAARRLVPILTTSLLILTPTTALAANYDPPAPRLVSGADPLPPFGADGSCGSDGSHQDWEFEPTLTVNPADDDNLVTAWTQDWNDAVVVAYSSDRGKHWKTVVPRTTPCTGGLTDFGTGPGFSTVNASLSTGAPLGTGDPLGVTYLTYNFVTPVDDPSRPYAQLVNRSLDGGKTWSAPVVLEAVDFPQVIDWSYVVADADPSRTGYAYAVWEVADRAGNVRHQHLSHTTDGGRTWSKPAEIPSATPQAGGKILALPAGPNGTLVDIVSEVPPQPAAALGRLTGPTTLMARRSTDLGRTWSAPTPITIADTTALAGASAALAPDGRTIYVAWMQTSDTNEKTYTALYSTSTDLGSTWTTPRPIGPNVKQPLFAGLNNQMLLAPNLAISTDGTLAAMFYDHRNDPYNAPPNITDLWLRHSHNGGDTWTEEHLAGPFNLAEAPERYIGGYQGLAPISGGFATTFTLARPLPGANHELAHPPTDIFFERITANESP